MDVQKEIEDLKGMVDALRFPGPGRDARVQQAVREMGILEDLLDKTKEIMKIDKKLENANENISEHDKKLNDHGAKLDAHDKKLNEYNVKLDQLKRSVEMIVKNVSKGGGRRKKTRRKNRKTRKTRNRYRKL